MMADNDHDRASLLPRAERAGDERLDDLCVNGWGAWQSGGDWRFSADTVRLAAFCRVRPRERILDLGMGDGALSFLLLARDETASAVGIECREAAVGRAEKGIRHNGLEARCRVIRGDVRDCRPLVGAASFTLAVSNPPYPGPAQKDQKYPDCRCMEPGEITLWIRSASWALKNRGRLCLVYPCAFLQQVLSAMENEGFALKRLQIVRTGGGCKVFLAEGVKGARPGGAQVGILNNTGKEFGDA